MELTDHQKWALCQIVSDIRKGAKEVSLGGFAGTGKSTIIKYLIKFFPRFAVCAYTGKAAQVLRKKEILGATTIHSRVYKPFFDNGITYWDLTPDPGCDGFIVDEASMVSEEIYNDLAYFDLPMIFVGDHGQLEPVDSKFNLMESPDYVLEEIHRNAGDIAKFAEHIRKGFAAKSFNCEDGSVQLIYDKKPDINLLTSVDQVICAFNKTRVEVNSLIRKEKGFTNLINIGEKVMCLRNNRRTGLFNGMQGIVTKLYECKHRKYMDFKFDDTVLKEIYYDASCFGQESYKIKHSNESPDPFDYAHAITCHKSQADEWDNVLVIEQKCNNWSHKRWAYTAASRAKKKLLWKIG